MKKNLLSASVQFFVLMLVPAVFQAQAPNIITDRPDQTESTATVQPGYFQGEHGFSMVELANGGRHISHPSTLFRFGLSEHWEVRMALEPTTFRTGDESKFGLAPLEVGFKAALLEEKGILPEISFLYHLHLHKVASEHLQAQHLASSFRFLLQHTMSERWSLGYNLGAAWDGGSPALVFEYTFSNSIGLTESLGCFFELYGFVPDGEEDAQHLFDAGLTYLVRPNFQLDISGGIGLTEHADNYFLSCGVAYRFPN